MIEYILLGGIMFVLGMLVGRHVGLTEGKHALMQYMHTVSSLHAVMHLVHVKHGIEDEVAERLREQGIEIRRIQIGNH